MKRMLLVLSAAILFLSTLAVPNIARADGNGSGNGGTCPPGQVCKP
jgi:hypothetical protein